MCVGVFRTKVKRQWKYGSIVRYGMLAFDDHQPRLTEKPLVLQLAGITYSADASPAATATDSQANATSNPAAQFFHHTCKAQWPLALVPAAPASWRDC
jgi:hypothetical protein